MSTETLQIPANLNISAPRGARWAANAAVALSRLSSPVNGWLHEIGQRRARRALLELARSVEATQPSYAQPLFVALAWWSGRGRPPLTRRDWLGVAGLGFSGYYLASFLDFAGLAYVSASFERLVLYLNPTIVLLLGWLLFGRRVGARALAAMALSYAGVALVFGRELGVQGEHAALGAALVFASALSYAFYLVYSGEFVQRLGALRLTGLATTVACLLCIAQFVLLRPLAAATSVAPEVIWLSLLNATACTFAPVLMVMMAIERIGSTLAAQTGMIGPLSTIFLGVLLLDEPVTPGLVAGTLLVLAGIALLARSRR